MSTVLLFSRSSLQLQERRSDCRGQRKSCNPLLTFLMNPLIDVSTPGWAFLFYWSVNTFIRFLKRFWEEQANRAQAYLQQALLPCCIAIKAQNGAWSKTTAALVKRSQCFQSVKCFCCTNKRPNSWIRSSGTEWFLPMNKSTHTQNVLSTHITWDTKGFKETCGSLTRRSQGTMETAGLIIEKVSKTAQERWPLINDAII